MKEHVFCNSPINIHVIREYNSDRIIEVNTFLLYLVMRSTNE